NNFDFGVDAFRAIDEQGGRIGVGRASPGGSHHGPVEPAFRREYSRRVDVNDLGRAFERNSADSAACCLNLAGNDRDLGSYELVDERRFARVRGADQGGKTTACFRARSAVHAAPFWPSW